MKHAVWIAESAESAGAVELCMPYSVQAARDGLRSTGATDRRRPGVGWQSSITQYSCQQDRAVAPTGAQSVPWCLPCHGRYQARMRVTSAAMSPLSANGGPTPMILSG